MSNWNLPPGVSVMDEHINPKDDKYDPIEAAFDIGWEMAWSMAHYENTTWESKEKALEFVRSVYGEAVQDLDGD